MEIVIKIRDDRYKEMTNHQLPYGLTDAIKKGTILPKGHGRLIDEMVLGDIISRMWKNKQITNTKYNTFLSILDYVATVIDADMEGREE